MTLQALLQPGRRLTQISNPKLIVQIRIKRRHPLKKAACVDIAKRIGWEISKQPHRPMDILQTPLRGTRHLISKISRKAIIPSALQILHLQIARNHRALQIKAQQHMQIILHLIGLSADETIAHRIYRFVKFIRAFNAKITKARAHFCKEKLGKGAAAAQLVFIDPRLAFMNAHGGTLPYGRQRILWINILLVTAMPHLMNGGIKAIERIAGVRACGDPDILP